MFFSATFQDLKPSLAIVELNLMMYKTPKVASTIKRLLHMYMYMCKSSILILNLSCKNNLKNVRFSGKGH